MGDYSPPTPSLSDSAVVEVTGKIMILAVIVLFIVVAFVFLLHIYARWFWSRFEDPNIVAWRRQLASQNHPSTAVPRHRGLSISTLQSLPVMVYNSKDFKDGLECTVCLSELQEGEKARVLPKCNHGFHADCIDMWFQSHSTCPICRTLVVSTDPDSDSSSTSSFDSDTTESSVDEGSNANFPTNVLFWGDETQVRSLELFSEPSSSSGGLVIDIPMASESCSPGAESEEKSPVLTRLRSLKRLLSRGKRVAPSPCSSSSGPGDLEQV